MSVFDKSRDLTFFGAIFVLTIGFVLLSITLPGRPPDLSPALSATTINTLVWNDRQMGDGSYMARCKTPDGWVVFVSKRSSHSDGGVSTNLLFVPDIEHAWIFK